VSFTKICPLFSFADDVTQHVEMLSSRNSRLQTIEAGVCDPTATLL